MNNKVKKRKRSLDIVVGDTVYIPAKVVSIHANGGQHPWKCYHVQYMVSECLVSEHLVLSEFVSKVRPLNNKVEG